MAGWWLLWDFWLKRRFTMALMNLLCCNFVTGIILPDHELCDFEYYSVRWMKCVILRRQSIIAFYDSLTGSHQIWKRFRLPQKQRNTLQMSFSTDELLSLVASLSSSLLLVSVHALQNELINEWILFQCVRLTTAFTFFFCYTTTKRRIRRQQQRLEHNRKT